MRKTEEKLGARYSPVSAKSEGEILPGVPGIRFIPSVAAIKEVLRKEVDNNEEIDDFRSIVSGAHIAVGMRGKGSDNCNGADGSQSQ